MTRVRLSLFRSELLMICIECPARVRRSFRASVACLGATLGLLLISASSASGQIAYDHTTFLNGFGSDSLIWATGYPDLGGKTTPQWLGQSVVLHTVANPNVNAAYRYSQQLASLVPVFSSGSQHVLVGHSLGSMIARGLYINYPSIQPNITGIVAIAAPHQGAPLADNFDATRRFMADVQRRVNDGLAAARAEASILNLFVPVGAKPLFIAIASIVIDKTTGQDINLGNIDQLGQVPALQDLQTHSAAVSSLNSSLADQAVPHANIYGTISPRNAALRVQYSLEGNDAGFNAAVSNRDKGVALLKGCKYIGYATIVMSRTARTCAYAVKVLGRVDERWSLYVNGANQFGAAKQVPFDGVVPNERSVYPVANNLRFNADVWGVDHMNIYATAAGLNQVAAGMLQIGMQSTAPPPPPGVTVSISGPTSVNMCGGSWGATPSGGTAPYSYSWTIAGHTYNTGTTGSLDWSPSTYGTFTLKVTATDATGLKGTSQMSVKASSQGMC